jgi:hypothetical protein
MEIKEVTTESDARDFLLLPMRIYRDDPNWIRPLNKDIEEVFDPARNKFFRHGKLIRYILKDNGEVTGRVAAFINDRTSKKDDQPTGGIGFFECIDDQNAANMLFDTCKEWLKSNGMEAMDGPVNFGERDSWWGLIVRGFAPPLYKMNYNPSYYQKLFEEYGFQTWFEQWCYSLKVHDPLVSKFHERHERIANMPEYKCEHIRKKNIDKYADDFRIVYNKAWAKHGGGKELEEKVVRKMFAKMKPVIDEKLIWFAYHNNVPVAMWVNLPDINQIFKKFNGHFNIIDKLRFVWMLRRRTSGKFIGLVFGIVPEEQGKGLDAYMIIEGATHIRNQTPYVDYEMQWIGDFNPKMVAIAENLGTQKSRVLKTYRYLFDRTKEFKRHPYL